MLFSGMWNIYITSPVCRPGSNHRSTLLIVQETIRRGLREFSRQHRTEQMEDLLYCTALATRIPCILPQPVIFLTSFFPNHKESCLLYPVYPSQRVSIQDPPVKKASLPRRGALLSLLRRMCNKHGAPCVTNTCVAIVSICIYATRLFYSLLCVCTRASSADGYPYCAIKWGWLAFPWSNMRTSARDTAITYKRHCTSPYTHIHKLCVVKPERHCLMWECDATPLIKHT